jgi:hypothetical protein
MPWVEPCAQGISHGSTRVSICRYWVGNYAVIGFALCFHRIGYVLRELAMPRVGLCAQGICHGATELAMCSHRVSMLSTASHQCILLWTLAGWLVEVCKLWGDGVYPEWHSMLRLMLCTVQQCGRKM